MITKPEFKKFMTELIQLKKDAASLCLAVKKFDPEFNYFSMGRVETFAVKVLEGSMNDTSEWISYWLYDCECGKRKDFVNSVTKHGKKVPFKTLDNLYECIIRKS